MDNLYRRVDLAREQLWPAGYSCAVSICFDDGLLSQSRLAIPLLSQYQLPATFYLSTSWMESPDAPLRRRLIDDWIDVSAAGHEIGNHTRSHPCTTNFRWVKDIPCGPLEGMSLAMIEQEIDAAQKKLQAEIGVTPISFAYPCGMTFVGRGLRCESYVPLVAKGFLVGRTYNSECAAAPLCCDLAQVPSTSMDNRPISELVDLIDNAQNDGTWLILVAHHITCEPAKLSTELNVLKLLLDYLTADRSRIWVDTVASIGRHVRDLQEHLVHQKI